MRYLPLSTEEKNKILSLCGVKSFEELTSQVPEKLRIKGLLDLPPALSESELLEHLGQLAAKNTATQMQTHLGQGVYDHFWPTVIDQITNRGEFLTAYTPYQPELSQGTLQCIFEFQSLITELYGMEIANASLYDGATAALEAVLMAARLNPAPEGKKRVVLVSEGTFEGTKQVLQSCLKDQEIEVKTWWSDPKTLKASAENWDLKDDEHPVAFFLQSPNRWGLIEDWDALKKLAQKFQSKSIAYVGHPLQPALFQAPGQAGIDIACGEGQSLGIPVGFGGPHLGLFACKRSDVRQMPGRLVGATEDAQGRAAFCVTLSTREQHIRREKATSNICSNQNLMALRACIYMTLMGPQGMKKVAQLSRNNAYYFRSEIKKVFDKKFPELKVLEGELFNEVTLLASPKATLWIDEALSKAQDVGILAGIKQNVPGACTHCSALTLAFTERHNKEQIDRLVSILGG